MASPTFDSNKLKAFQEAAQSLKLYRRADLIETETNSSLIEDLYVDPLPEEHVLRTLLRAHTTYLIGRKGTGKSTLFQRLQSELRKNKYQTSAYIDIKTVYESSLIDPLLASKVIAIKEALPPEVLSKFWLYREFIFEVISEIKNEIKKRIDASFWEKVKEHFTGNINELFEGLDELLEDVKHDKFISVVGLHLNEVRQKEGSSMTESQSEGFKLNLQKDPQLNLEANKGFQKLDNNEVEVKYADVLIRSFNIKQIIVHLKKVLEKSGIRNLYILVDDFSELPQDAMQIVVDVLLTPLNNWSDEFIKFKIAAYPGRIYYGQIDKTKVDEIYLDLYKLYGGGDVTRMEENAISFTRRIVESRVEHFCKVSAVEYMDEETDVWRELFYASMANPRILGYILHYLHESHLIRGKKIGTSAVQEAAQRYYEEKIESYFTIGKFLHEVFSERSSIFSLKELLEEIVKRARDLRTHESQVIKKIAGRPPTSHFYVPIQYESLFSSLELNFFMTKYFEMSDRSGRKVTIFALNYGLCNKYSIKFGRPVGEREFRLYFVERIFDYTPIFKAYFSKNQEIVCENCGHRYSFENLEALRFYNMRCKECNSGKVTVLNLSKKYEAELRAVNQDLLLPSTELGILQTLHIENSPLRPHFIAAELDCSYQLIGKRARNLADLGLIKRSSNPAMRYYEIEDLAQKAYFSDTEREELDVPKDDIAD